MDNKLIEKLALFYLLTQSLCVVILLELIVFGKPFFTLFFLILAGTIYLNFKIIKH